MVVEALFEKLQPPPAPFQEVLAKEPVPVRFSAMVLPVVVALNMRLFVPGVKIAVELANQEPARVKVPPKVRTEVVPFAVSR